MNGTNSSPRHSRHYYAGYVKHYTQKNILLLGLCGLFLLGVLAGTLLVRTSDADTQSVLLRLVSGFVEKRRDASLWENFTSELSASLLVLVILFVGGFCAVAQPLELLVPFFRGLGFGFSVASLYAGYGAGAIGFVSLFLLPGMVLSTLAILFCCRESLRLSGSFFAVLRRQDKELYPVNTYCARYVAASVLCAVNALIGAVLYFAFIGYFHLG